MTNNTFKTGLSTFTIDHLREAEHFTNALFQDSLIQRYRELSSEELHSFLTTAFDLTDEHGLVNLLPGEKMPSDFRDLMMYRPSYCVIAAGIYACTHFRMADEPLMDHLKHLLDAAIATYKQGMALTLDTTELEAQQQELLRSLKTASRRGHRLQQNELCGLLDYATACADGRLAFPFLQEWLRLRGLSRT